MIIEAAMHYNAIGELISAIDILSNKSLSLTFLRQLQSALLERVVALETPASSPNVEITPPKPNITGNHGGYRAGFEAGLSRCDAIIASLNARIDAAERAAKLARSDEELLSGCFDRVCKALGLDSGDHSIEDVERVILRMKSGIKSPQQEALNGKVEG